MTYCDYKSIERSLWRSYIETHEDSNVFHSVEFAEAIEKLDNCTPIALSQERDGKIVALAVGYVYTEFSNFLLKRLTQRALFQGGILFSKNADVNSFLERLAKLCKSNKAIYSNIVQKDESNSVAKIFRSQQYESTSILNYIFDLNDGLDAIWSGFKSKKRQNIRKAFKNGLIVTEGNVGNLYEVYLCVQYTYKKLKLPLFDFKYLEVIFKELYQKQMIKIFLALVDDKIVATRISLYFNNKAYDWYAGSYDEYSKFNANDVLVWESLKNAVDSDCGLFDFGGAGIEGEEYGVRDFKSKFGGELRSFLTFKKVHNQLLDHFIRFGKKLL